MFEDEAPKEKDPVDYTGYKILAMLVPVFLLFVYMGKADMGLAVCLVLGVILVAIKFSWNLRKHVWYWAIIVFILALHVPLVLAVRLPKGSVPIIVYAMPLGIADYLIISGAVRLGEKIFLGNSLHDEEEE
ncbi:MAG: hypothetical protein ACLQLH_09485 [Terracidiphilus sp.]